LSVNVIPIKGKYENEQKGFEAPPGLVVPQYIFTEGNYDSRDGFWPFVEYLDKYTNYNYPIQDTFNGIFYNYNIVAFVVYIALGLGIVFLPKFWGTERTIIPLPPTPTRPSPLKEEEFKVKRIISNRRPYEYLISHEEYGNSIHMISNIRLNLGDNIALDMNSHRISVINRKSWLVGIS